MTRHSAIVGRLAPSPTGAQHVGNARTYLIAWLSARSRGGRVVLRIEDIDSPRVKPGAAQGALDDLRWLGLDWDDGPIFQSDRLALYESALRLLQDKELVYPCTCRWSLAPTAGAWRNATAIRALPACGKREFGRKRSLDFSPGHAAGSKSRSRFPQTN